MRARASFALALILKRWSDNAADMADADSPRAWQMARFFGEAVAERIRMNPRAITEEAERLFEQVRETARGRRVPGGVASLEAADRAVYEMRDLAVGKPAPEIVGRRMAWTAGR